MTTQQFNALPKREKKIKVAKDVLAQLKANKYIANSGQYIVFSEEGFSFSKADIKKNFSKIKNCHVCGIGSCLLSVTKFANQLAFNDLDDFYEPDYYLGEEKKRKFRKSSIIINVCFFSQRIGYDRMCF